MPVTEIVIVRWYVGASGGLVDLADIAHLASKA
jgi:hypothetical protein